MRIAFRALMLGILVSLAIVAVRSQEEKTDAAPPLWAYPTAPPNNAGGQQGRPTAGQRGAPADEPQEHVANSTMAFTPTQIRDGFNTADWHPNEHPPMPDIVAHGSKPDVRACSWCHFPTGIGRADNSSLAGLSAAYIEEQVADFKSGARKSSQPRFGPLMTSISKAATDAEVQTASEYYAALKPKVSIRVVEAAMVPKTTVAGGMLTPVEGGGMEPIGERIIEVPENPALTDLRDEDNGFIAYVPVGSLAKGAVLVTSGGGGKTLQCRICHGPELKGIGYVPRLAGRSPSYLFRQLYDIQHGNRMGLLTQLMKEPVAHLTQDDMISIVAYLASLPPD